MSGASVAKKINKAFKKVGTKLGFDFEHYRPDSYFLPVADRNSLGTKRVGFSEVSDTSWVKGPYKALAFYNLYTEFSNVQGGDYFNSVALGEQFVVIEVTPIRGPIGIRCESLVDVLRPMTDMSAAKKRSLTEVATSVPMAVDFNSSASDDGALSVTSSIMSGGVMKGEAWTWVVSDTIKLNDVLVISGSKYLVQSVNQTAAGTFLKFIATKT